jgi:hypothetical protein
MKRKRQTQSIDGNEHTKTQEREIKRNERVSLLYIEES